MVLFVMLFKVGLTFEFVFDMNREFIANYYKHNLSA